MLNCFQQSVLNNKIYEVRQKVLHIFLTDGTKKMCNYFWFPQYMTWVLDLIFEFSPYNTKSI